MVFKGPGKMHSGYHGLRRLVVEGFPKSQPVIRLFGLAARTIKLHRAVGGFWRFFQHGRIQRDGFDRVAPGQKRVRQVGLVPQVFRSKGGGAAIDALRLFKITFGRQVPRDFRQFHGVPATGVQFVTAQSEERIGAPGWRRQVRYESPDSFGIGAIPREAGQQFKVVRYGLLRVFCGAVSKFHG